MATNAQGKPSASDLTATRRASLAKEHEKELQDRQESLSLAAAAEAKEHATTVVDVTKRPEQPVVVDEVEVVEDEEGVVVRLNEDLQAVTIGDRVYDFVAGRKYKVPQNVAFHLEEKGRIWR